MNFTSHLDPDGWYQNARGATSLGFSTEVNRQIDIQDTFGEEHDWMNYDLEVSPKENNTNEGLLEGEGPDLEMSEDGFFYDLRIMEQAEKGSGKEGRHLVDDGLLTVHFTAYRDEDGDDYIVHSDPKKWTSEGKRKYEEKDGFADIETGLKDTEEWFSDEDNYRMEEGLKQAEEYLDQISEEEEEPLSTRWNGLREALNTFREGISPAKPVNTNGRKQKYAN